MKTITEDKTTAGDDQAPLKAGKAPAAPQRWTAAVSGALIATLVGAGGWLSWYGHRPAQPAAPRQVYTAQGYGGFVTAAAPRPPATAGESAGTASAGTVPADPVQPVRDAYNAGRYADAERQAQRVILAAWPARTAALRRQAVDARQVLAYAAARRHDLALARVRFAALQAAAGALPDQGRQPTIGGNPQPTLEAEGAFQQAVCTGALGDSNAAEAQYRAFMTRYPDSPLVAAAVKRIARMHGGDLPPADEAVWRQAQVVAAKRAEMQARGEALCGPECLAEMLRRQGRAADVHGLARELGTSGLGTSLLALAAAARKRGFGAQGLALTQTGLAAQGLPLIALVAPGHYLLVEAVGPAQVTVWDPDAHGIGRSARRSVPLPEWGRMWRGVALALRPNVVPAQRAGSDAAAVKEKAP